ncbi:unnamed protein product [Amoebophrya sp. A120]|nr:unnamed protein product [Amoebophrya sp. A120]|eukprot:GSA120T00004776001.1
MTTETKKQTEKTDNVVRISKAHNASFYVRAATNFLQGITGKDGVEKKIFDEVVISALGAAIPAAATVVGLLEKNKVASLTKVETAYTQLDYGKRPHLLLSVKRNPDYVAPKKTGKTIEPPACPERLTTDKLEKKMKKVLKEGGKRGVEIEGAADMGGLKYFCTKVLEPAGDLDMLVESVKAMNAKSDPSEEERKGGSGKIGKTVMSMADDNNLCIVTYVPQEEHVACSAKDWLEYILKMCSASSQAIREDSTDLYAQICVKNDGEKGVFALKMRDYVIQHANKFLHEKHLIPDQESESEDEMVFGDDDFP